MVRKERRRKAGGGGGEKKESKREGRKGGEREHLEAGSWKPSLDSGPVPGLRFRLTEGG
jgi:hypothetical protein